MAAHHLCIERTSTFTSGSYSEVLLIYCPCFQMVIKVSVTCADLRVGNCLAWIISFPRKWGQFPGHNIAISVKYLDRICHNTEIVRIDIFHLTSPHGIRRGGLKSIGFTCHMSLVFEKMVLFEVTVWRWHCNRVSILLSSELSASSYQCCHLPLGLV